MASKEVLEQACENCNEHYCTIREILSIKNMEVYPCNHVSDNHDYCPNILSVIKNGISDRFIFQIKCIEELKWIKSQEQGRELSWDEAGMLWVEEGYAKKFAEVWNAGVRDIYFFFREGTVPKRKYAKLDHILEAV